MRTRTQTPPVARVVAAAALTALTVFAPVSGMRQADAAPWAQLAPSACHYDGVALLPKVDANHPYGWGFAANFDHAVSGSTVTTCLAERYYGQAPWQTSYTVSTAHCAVVSNGGPVSVGGGSASFNGNFRLACTLPVTGTTPSLFWIKTRAALSAPSSSATFLSASGAGMSFAVSNDAACAVTLNSAYNSISFAHSASGACGAYTAYGSQLRRTGANALEGRHKIGPATYGPVSGGGAFSLPANFTFDIGAIGQSFTLDWLVIDPTPTRCCSPG